MTGPQALATMPMTATMKAFTAHQTRKHGEGRRGGDLTLADRLSLGVAPSARWRTGGEAT